MRLVLLFLLLIEFVVANSVDLSYEKENFSKESFKDKKRLISLQSDIKIKKYSVKLFARNNRYDLKDFSIKDKNTTLSILKSDIKDNSIGIALKTMLNNYKIKTGILYLDVENNTKYDIAGDVSVFSYPYLSDKKKIESYTINVGVSKEKDDKLSYGLDLYYTEFGKLTIKQLSPRVEYIFNNYYLTYGLFKIKGVLDYIKKETTTYKRLNFSVDNYKNRYIAGFGFNIGKTQYRIDDSYNFNYLGEDLRKDYFIKLAYKTNKKVTIFSKATYKQFYDFKTLATEESKGVEATSNSIMVGIKYNFSR